jgi:hypothetical protein
VPAATVTPGHALADDWAVTTPAPPRRGAVVAAVRVVGPGSRGRGARAGRWSGFRPAAGSGAAVVASGRRGAAPVAAARPRLSGAARTLAAPA